MSSGVAVRLLISALLATVLGACSSAPISPLDPLHEATVLIEHAKGHGTGTIVGPHAVLTAYHVVQEAPLEVTFFNGPAVGGPGHLVRREARSRADRRRRCRRLRAVELDCENLRAGQHLVSVGHPTQSRWVAVGGHLPAIDAIGGARLVQLGFPIGLGTSGGPVFDDKGRVVGVALAILAERSPSSAAYDRYKDTGIGLMLPARDFCEALGVER